MLEPQLSNQAQFIISTPPNFTRESTAPTSKAQSGTERFFSSTVPPSNASRHTSSYQSTRFIDGSRYTQQYPALPSSNLFGGPQSTSTEPTVSLLPPFYTTQYYAAIPSGYAFPTTGWYSQPNTGYSTHLPSAHSTTTTSQTSNAFTPISKNVELNPDSFHAQHHGAFTVVPPRNQYQTVILTPQAQYPPMSELADEIPVDDAEDEESEEGSSDTDGEHKGLKDLPGIYNFSKQLTNVYIFLNVSELKDAEHFVK